MHITDFVRILVIVLLSVAGNAQQGPRIISTSSDELVVPSLSNFVLECQFTEPIEWTLPRLSHHFVDNGGEYDIPNRTNITLSQVNIPGGGTEFRSRLEVRNAKYLDTGYFICHKKDSLDFDNPALAKKIYVYVEDKDKLIVAPGEDDFVSIFAQQSTREIIPCKPTSPSVQMTLTDDENHETLATSDGKPSGDWSYDPRRGFILQEVHIGIHSSQLYICRAKLGEGEEETVTISMHVMPATASAPKPIIDDSRASHVMVGQDFQLNCSASVELSTAIDLTWSVPPGSANDSRISTTNLTAHNSQAGGTLNKVAHVVLRVSKAKKEDEGFYTCMASDHTNKSDKTAVYVEVHEDGVSYANISDEGLAFEIESSANQSVKWVVNFKANPKPEVIWFKSGKPDVVIVQNPSKYLVKNEARRTTLEILNLEGMDSGYYTVSIKTSKAEDARNFTLKVKDKPHLKAYSGRAFFKTDENFQITCEIHAHPRADVRILFRPCVPATELQKSEHNRTFNPKECKGEWSLLFSNGKMGKIKQNEENIWLIPIDYRSQVINVTGRARIGGEYLCEANNSFGNSKTSPLSLVKIGINNLDADVSAIEFKRSQKRAPVVNENFNLSCGVSLYNFMPKLTWTRTFNGTLQTLHHKSPPPGLHFSVVRTNYTYTEVLNWDRMPESASGNYTCHATNNLNQNLSAVTSLMVGSGKKPLIEGHSELTVSIQKNTELRLYCNGTGLPTPSIQWFKDGVLIQNGLSLDKTTLSIVYANSDDSGFYVCEFTNIIDSDRRVFSVSIQEPPLSSGIIAGIVIVSIIVVVLLALLIHKILQDKKRKAFFAAHQLDMFDKGNPESINPDLPVDEQAELLPYDRKWEFPRERLKLGKQLGAGAFGRVLKADALGIVPSEPITTVAVKMVRSQGNMIGLKALMSELKIMIHMGSHLNVVNLLGACTKNVTKGELLVIVEYCRYGNIQNYLIKHRSRFINELDQRGQVVSVTGTPLTLDTPRSPSRFPFDSADYNGAQAVETEVTLLSDGRSGEVTYQTDGPLDSGGKLSLMSSPSRVSETEWNQAPWRSNYRGDYRDEPDRPVCTRDLICWAFQIARGMEYLARRKILHGDLAARNVLLAEHNIVKIADFGLAREVYRSGNYKKKGEGPLPVKWMAIESIIDRVFSTQSDVWSFGIVLWELFSLGKTPYPGMEADEYFFAKVKQGYRMEQPKYAPSGISEVMRECWLHDPMSRPSFCELADKLGALLETSVRRHYVELNEAYDQTNQGSSEADYLGMMAPVDYVNVGSRTPVPERRDYVNVPQNDESRDSDYLPMERLSPKDKPVSDDAYLFMSSPRSTPQTSPLAENANQFDFNFAPKLRTADEPAEADSVEMRRMMPKSREPEQNGPSPNAATGFSNPNYQNPPIIVSDLDDLPPDHYTMPRVLSLKSDNYVNVTDHSRDSHVEPHYAQPKNNGLVV